MIKYTLGERNFATAKLGGVKYSCEALVAIEPGQETIWQDFWFSGVGGLFIQGRKNVDKLKELLPKVKKIVEEIDATDEMWTDEGITVLTKVIMSKYLPNARDFDDCANAIKKAASYFAQLKDPGKYDNLKLLSFFDNTAYCNYKKCNKLNKSDANLTSVIYNKPGQSRGWNSKQQYLRAISTCSQVLSSIDSMISAGTRLKKADTSNSNDGNIKKQCIKHLGISIELGCQLVRGVEQAMLYAVKSPLNKFFTNLIGAKE